MNWKTCKEVEKSLTISHKCKKLFLIFNFLRIYVKLNKETTETERELESIFFLYMDPESFLSTLNLGLVLLQDFLAIRFMQSQTELKLRKRNHSGKSALDKRHEKTFKKLYLNFYQKQNCKMKLFFPSSFSVVKFSLWFFLCFSFFTLWLQNLHSVINSGLCLLSTYIQMWTPPSYADPIFRNQSRCRCPAQTPRLLFSAPRDVGTTSCISCEISSSAS